MELHPRDCLNQKILKCVLYSFCFILLLSFVLMPKLDEIAEKVKFLDQIYGTIKIKETVKEYSLLLQGQGRNQLTAAKLQLTSENIEQKITNTLKLAPQNFTKFQRNCTFPSILNLTQEIPVIFPNLTFNELSEMYTYLDRGGHNKPVECFAAFRVAIIVPYRNRDIALRNFLFHMHSFLSRQLLDYAIFIVEQTGNQTFNRAKLLNVGATEAMKVYDWDCFIFHDVDLLPESDRNLYKCPNGPKHVTHMSVAVSSMGYRLANLLVFGGVAAVKVDQFKKINGYSNEYWGWGGEDDDIGLRIRRNGLRIQRPHSSIGRFKMLLHPREKDNRMNPCRWKWKKPLASTRWKVDGLNSLKYKLLGAQFVDNLYTKFTVDLLETQSRAAMEIDGQC